MFHGEGEVGVALQKEDLGCGLSPPEGGTRGTAKPGKAEPRLIVLAKVVSSSHKASGRGWAESSLKGEDLCLGQVGDSTCVWSHQGPCVAAAGGSCCSADGPTGFAGGQGNVLGAESPGDASFTLLQ